MKKDPMLSSYLLKDKRTGETFEKEELRAREKAGLKNKDVEIIPRDDLVAGLQEDFVSACQQINYQYELCKVIFDKDAEKRIEIQVITGFEPAVKEYRKLVESIYNHEKLFNRRILSDNIEFVTMMLNSRKRMHQVMHFFQRKKDPFLLRWFGSRFSKTWRRWYKRDICPALKPLPLLPFDTRGTYFNNLERHMCCMIYATGRYYFGVKCIFLLLFTPWKWFDHKFYDFFYGII